MAEGSGRSGRRMRLSPAEGITGFAILIPGGTEPAKRLKGRRIPFTVGGAGSPMGGDWGDRLVALSGLLKASLGEVFIMVTDTKRLGGVPWVSRYGGETASERASQAISEVETLLPDVSMIVLLSRGSAWWLGGYRFCMPEARLRDLFEHYAPLLDGGGDGDQ